jgi:hypothetical protein
MALPMLSSVGHARTANGIRSPSDDFGGQGWP